MEANQETRFPPVPPDEVRHSRELWPAVGTYALAVWVATAAVALALTGRSDHVQGASERFHAVAVLAAGYGLLFVGFLPSLVCYLRRTHWSIGLAIQVGVLVLLFVAFVGLLLAVAFLTPGLFAE